VISHDTYPAGAQHLLLALLRRWRRHGSFPVKVICVSSGALRDEFADVFPTLFLSDFPSNRLRRRALLDFIDGPVRAIYSNTVVNGPLLDELRSILAPVITHCHELQASIERWAAGHVMTDTLSNTDYTLAASAGIARNLRTRHQVPQERLEVIHAFIDYWDSNREPTAEQVAAIKRELDIEPNHIVVFGCGTTDWRKGSDIFLRVALAACRVHPGLKFVWIGGDLTAEEQAEIQRAGCERRIRFIGKRAHARHYFYAGDIFALTSREDPCPLVALEAANAQLPVVSFAGSGDIPEVLGAECGAVVAFEDAQGFVEAVLELAEDPRRRRTAGNAGNARVRDNHNTDHAGAKIDAAIDKTIELPRKALGRLRGAPLVTVIVPNYNHRRFLEQRLSSIAGQSLRDIEIIVLDDASTDGSPDVLEGFVSGERRSTLLRNAHNSGSTFKQWRKGLERAQGRYVWIAESDDFADTSFLTRTVALLESDSSLMIAHAQSMMTDVEGKHLGRPDGWVDDLSPGRWNVDFRAAGIAEIRDYLCQKNTIPNASAVVFRNFPGIEFLVDDGMRLCADWLFWIRLLARGNYAFIAQELNYWRQSSSNARTRLPGVLEWEEGQRILTEAAAILGLNNRDRHELLERFHKRCFEWSGGKIEPLRVS